MEKVLKQNKFDISNINNISLTTVKQTNKSSVARHNSSLLNEKKRKTKKTSQYSIQRITGPSVVS